MRLFLLVLVVVGAVVLGVVMFVPVDRPAAVAMVPGKLAPAAQGDLPASSVLRINPRSTPAPPASPVKSAPIVSADIAQLRQRKGWPELHARVSSGPQTPEALYILAELYSGCAKRQASTTMSTTSTLQAEAREKFIATLKGDPNGEQRIGAYEKTKANPCEGLALGDFSRERLAQMVEAAAAAGDVRAQSWQLSQQIERAYFDAQPRPEGYGVSDEQMESIRRLLASGEPGVLNDFHGILSSTLLDANLRMVPNNERVDNSAMAAALTLVACDLGASCGPDSQRLLMQCAMQGYCAANNLYDYTYFYESSPHQAQLLEQYRQALLQMVNGRDFSGLRLTREPTTPGMVQIRGGRRGP